MKKIIITKTFGIFLGLLISLFTNPQQLMLIFSFVTGACFAIGLFLMFDRKKSE